ncbi:Aste57867_396 [Aphanomyces stellatus]|uniref:Aste57867_396 protein n=1 Tax=Aphanomyces stellatus TaxID=120398 RepID=A0A485K2I4_9STRA|nr:hypothetical protein As57867_000395 [Aphanomyces stellatus]VFT77621.1 Aste57867_396 [Aphanomyces stellatus]
MTLTALLCSDDVPEQSQQGDDRDMMQEDENTTAEGASTGQNNSSNSSSPSKTDAKMLDYFMEFSNSSDENRKKLTRKVKHRINNKRHRQRKQIELDQLRRDVPDLEDQLGVLQTKHNERRSTTAQRSLWHHLTTVEKKKLDAAVEERDLLQKTIKAHDVLVKLYETQLEKNGFADCPWNGGGASSTTVVVDHLDSKPALSSYQPSMSSQQAPSPRRARSGASKDGGRRPRTCRSDTRPSAPPPCT